MKPMKIFVAGMTSDIGWYICERYMEEGHSVFGTYRVLKDHMIRNRVESAGGKLFFCDYSDSTAVDKCVESIRNHNPDIRWDVFISAVGVMDPISVFSESDINLWEKNVYINAISQLRLLRGVLLLRNPKASVFFMTSKGMNDTFPEHSAYCVSKVILVKMCELLDDEINDCSFVAFNPGFINTKIIQQEKRIAISQESTECALDRVWRFIKWARTKDKRIISGRNFFIKYDSWEEDGVVTELLRETNHYKLRRCGDIWFLGGKQL